MAFRRTAYNTSAGSAFVTTKLRLALEEIAIKEYVLNQVVDAHSGTYYAGVITGMGKQVEVPVFAHPFEMTRHDHKFEVYADYRSMVGKPKNEGSYPIVTQQIEWRMMRLRHLLNIQWLSLNPNIFRDVSNVPAAVYASWISEGIGRRFGLDPKEQQQVGILAACFYQSLFSDDNLSADALEAVAIKATRSPFALVSETVGQIDQAGMNNIGDLCEVIKKVLDNPRLKDLNSGILITLLSGGWFGLNAREVLAVALEHPPTWLTVVYFALLERTYRNAGISRIAERFAKAKGGDAFIKSLDNVTEDYKGFADTFFDLPQNRPTVVAG